MKTAQGYGQDPTVSYVVAENGCWEWQGRPGSHGYGQANRDGRTTVAHRYMYERACGPIPNGMHLHHVCRNRACVNPAHLQIITPAEHQKESRANRRLGSRNLKLTWDDVREIRNSDESHAALGRRYGVTLQNIARIRKNETWVEDAD
jgi:hypothetical protein